MAQSTNVHPFLPILLLVQQWTCATQQYVLGVFMGTYDKSMDQPGMVANPRLQLNRENADFSVPVRA